MTAGVALCFVCLLGFSQSVPQQMGSIKIVDEQNQNITALLEIGSGMPVSPSTQDSFIGVEGCPMDCSGRGYCKFGQCQCDAGYLGPACEYSLPCLNDCSGNGVCKGHSCFCYKGYTGGDCSKPAACPNDCANHGRCDLGRCVCDDGWTGKDCSRAMDCPYKCIHGACIERMCVCEEGFVGATCDEVNYCMTNCSGHGTCHEFRCYCDMGYSGLTCAELVPCPHDCSGHGNCVNGTCQCNLGYTGLACDEDCCPNALECDGTTGLCQRTPCNCHNDCNHKGICHRGRCLCRRGYIGEDCGLKLCPNNCTGNGLCDLKTGLCTCIDGWSGALCDQVACPNNCSGNGACIEMDGERVCMCGAGFTGPDCAIVIPCPGDCNGHGACEKGTCFCAPGYLGEDCSELVPPDQIPPGGFVSCPKDCSGQGRCDEELGICICDDQYKGADCSVIKECPNNCTGQGVCARGMCFCRPLFTGEDCSIALCLNNCSGVGHCKDGTCFCNPGRFGLDCAKYHCPNQCSGHGKCDHSNGQCGCEAPWAREDCSVIPCPDECSGNGDCDFKTGTCYCYEGFEGHNCSQSNKCFNDCFERGPCVKGECFCHQNFSGVDCSVIVRPPPAPGFTIAGPAHILNLVAAPWPRSGAPPQAPFNEIEIQKDLFRRAFGENRLTMYWYKANLNEANKKKFASCWTTQMKTDGSMYDNKESCAADLVSLFNDPPGTCTNQTAEEYWEKIQDTVYLREAFAHYYGTTKVVKPNAVELVRHNMPPAPPPVDPLPEGVLTVVPKPTPPVRKPELLFRWADIRQEFDDFWETEKEDFESHKYMGTDWEDNFKALLAQWSPGKWAAYWENWNSNATLTHELHQSYSYIDPPIPPPTIVLPGASGPPTGLTIEGPKRHFTGADPTLTTIPSVRKTHKGLQGGHSSVQNNVVVEDNTSQVETFEKNGITFSRDLNGALPAGATGQPSSVGVSSSFASTSTIDKDLAQKAQQYRQFETKHQEDSDSQSHSGSSSSRQQELNSGSTMDSDAPTNEAFVPRKQAQNDEDSSSQSQTDDFGHNQEHEDSNSGSHSTF